MLSFVEVSYSDGKKIVGENVEGPTSSLADFIHFLLYMQALVIIVSDRVAILI